MEETDLFIIGGGINGAAIARDGAGRGLRVMLGEQNDYASATSSASSKLIHGGLRYLENYEFPLVRAALIERARLMQLAPHLVFPQQFLMPILHGGQTSRPSWMLRAGLGLYDMLGRPDASMRSGRIAKADWSKIPLLPRLRFEKISALLHYHDARTNDARLTLSCLLDARARGAKIMNYCKVTAITAAENSYILTLNKGGHQRRVRARFVINCAGPWVEEVAGLLGQGVPHRALRLVRGSHIVLPAPELPLESSLNGIGAENRPATILQNHDGRIVFTIPWFPMGYEAPLGCEVPLGYEVPLGAAGPVDKRYIIIGTTDQLHQSGPDNVQSSAEEQDYLLEIYNRYFIHSGSGGTDAQQNAATSEDIVMSWSGLRALVAPTQDETARPSKISRAAAFSTARNGQGGYIAVYGGKLTTHRVLAEQVLEELAQMGLHCPPGWTDAAPYYGGSLNRAALENAAQSGPVEIPLHIRLRWAFSYGDQIYKLYERFASHSAQRAFMAPDIYTAELNFCAEEEDAKTGEDFMRRRTESYITLTAQERSHINAFFQHDYQPGPQPS